MKPLKLQVSATGSAQLAARAGWQRAWVSIAARVGTLWVVIPFVLYEVARRLNVLFPTTIHVSGSYGSLAVGLIAGGLLLIAVALGLTWFENNNNDDDAEVNVPGSRLMTSGVYWYVHHPVYVGYVMAFAGASILFDSFWALAFCLPLLVFTLVVRAVFIEERRLLVDRSVEYVVYRRSPAFFLRSVAVRVLYGALAPILRPIYSLLNKMAQWTILFQWGDAIFVTYGLAVTIGAFLTMQFAASLLVAQGVPLERLPLLFVNGIVLTVLFNKLFWLLGRLRTMIDQPFLGMRNVGYVSWGAYVGMVLSAVAFGWVYGYSPLMIVDVLARTGGIAYVFTRIGCLTYGCCWGAPTRRIGIVYANPASKVIRLKGEEERGVVRHPTQFYSVVLGVLVLAATNGISAWASNLPPGFLTAVFFFVYGLGRIVIEFLREGDRYLGGTLTASQIGCVAVVVGSLAACFVIEPTSAVTSSSPVAWKAELAVNSVSFLPFNLVASAIVFFAYSFHWKKLGSW